MGDERSQQCAIPCSRARLNFAFNTFPLRILSESLAQARFTRKSATKQQLGLPGFEAVEPLNNCDCQQLQKLEAKLDFCTISWGWPYRRKGN